MKEKIYTIPVNEAFAVDCECPLCVLEKKLEDKAVEYFLGPSLMEPDARTETNEKGFCRHHFEKLFNRRENTLGLGLVLDTHLVRQTEILSKLYQKSLEGLQKDASASAVKNLSGKLSSRQTETDRFASALSEHLSQLEQTCCVCEKVNHTMDRYVDVVLYLWFKEPEFQQRFADTRGFCLRHFHLLTDGSEKYLSNRDSARFLAELCRLQLKNLERMQQEVDWFTKKFDYRNNDAPWGTSRDAVPRGIQKVTGYCDV